MRLIGASRGQPRTGSDVTQAFLVLWSNARSHDDGFLELPRARRHGRPEEAYRGVQRSDRCCMTCGTSSVSFEWSQT